jgi:hypothetical protein
MSSNKMKNKFKNKDYKDIVAEEPVELSVRPSNKPIKQDIDSQKLDNIQINRLQAYRLMKKKVLTKEELTSLSGYNLNNEELNKQMHQNAVNALSDSQLNSYDKKDLSLINQFEEFYKQKQDPDNIPSTSYLDKRDEENIASDNLFSRNKNDSYEVNMRYVIGTNLNSVYSFCFHKDEKWIVYISQNLVRRFITK